jgi:hypothetical protein
MKADRITAALLAGLGAGFGWILFRALSAFPGHVGQTPQGMWGFLLQMAVAVILVISFIQPLERLMHRWVGYVWRADGALWTQVWGIFLICVGVLLELLVDRVDHTRSAMDLVQAIALVGLITYAWLGGVGLRGGATLWGFVTGVFAGTVVTMCTWLLRGGYMFNAQVGQFQQRDFWRALDTAVGSGLFLWGLVGLAGGLAIDYFGERNVAIKVLVTMAGVLIVTDFLLRSPNWSPNMAMVLGWGLGLVVRPSFGRALVRVSGKAA